ncbi:MAG: molybdopterin-binding protein [Alphaproteobacteria bacterium]|nr:molybdopterin-binding protein [Alphaproteobacteria bacterium]
MHTSAIIVIGSEIISGRTQDLNVQFLAQKLDQRGIDLKEVRIITDDENMIIETVNALRSKYNYIFTTGGIGPTHDDITALSIAKAFNLPLIRHPEIVDLIQKRKPKTVAASYRMADVPEGSTLIGNPVTQVPGFKIENVYVFAGIPEIMQGMFASIEETLVKGLPTLTKTIHCHMGESLLADGLSTIQHKFKEVEIGSYPYQIETDWHVNVVVRSKDPKPLNAATQNIVDLIQELGGEPVQV